MYIFANVTTQSIKYSPRFNYCNVFLYENICFKINIKIKLILSQLFIYQLMHKTIALKRILKFKLKQLLYVSVSLMTVINP